MTTENDKSHKETFLKQLDSCEDNDDNEDACINADINLTRCKQTTGTTSGILASSAALLESIGNMKLRSRSQEQAKITQQKQQTSTILTSGFGLSIDTQKDIKLLSPSLVRKKVKQDNITNNKVSDDASKSSSILHVQEQEGEPQQDRTNTETMKKLKQEEELVDEGTTGRSSLIVKAESVVRPDDNPLLNDKEENNSLSIKTETQELVLFTSETKNSEILLNTEQTKQTASKANTISLLPKSKTTHKEFSSNTIVPYGGIETTPERSGPVTTVATERLPSQESNATSPAKLIPDVTNGATSSFTYSDTNANSIDCKTTNYTNSNNIMIGKPTKRRPYRRTKRPIGYNDRSSITVVNTDPGGKNSMSTVPLNVYDAILQESNDLMAAASEAQQLGRYKMASAYLRFLHARLVGLGKRFDTKRLKTQCQDRTTNFSCNKHLTNDTSNHSHTNVAHNAFSVKEHVGDESEKKFAGKAQSEIEKDDGGNANDHAVETKQEVEALSNDRRNRGTESDAVAALAKLFPNIPIDKTMYEHLKKAAAELHAARSVSIEGDPSPRTEVFPGINNRTDKGVGVSPLCSHVLLQASDNTPDTTSTTMTSIAWTEHEKQTIQDALASGERHPRRIAGLIPSRTEQQVKAYLRNQTQLARVEVDLDFLPQENTTASAVSAAALAVLPRLDNDMHGQSLIQDTIERCQHGNDKQQVNPILTGMTDVTGYKDRSNRKRASSFVEESAESKGDVIGKRKKAERKNVSTIEYSMMSPYINLNQNVPDRKDDFDVNNTNDEGKTELISHDMVCEDSQEQHKSKQGTPLKRKGGRGKKPETAAVNTVPNAICNARALLQGTLLNSSSST